MTPVRRGPPTQVRLRGDTAGRHAPCEAGQRRVHGAMNDRRDRLPNDEVGHVAPRGAEAASSKPLAVGIQSA